MTPETLKIGPFVIAVSEDDAKVRQARMEDGQRPENGVAVSDMFDQTITIREGLAPDQLRATLVHELLHWCIEVAGAEQNEASA